MGIETPSANISRLPFEEGDGFYNVWKIVLPGKECILKEAKGNEADTYRFFFSEGTPFAPTLLGTAKVGEKEYILISYAPGENLCRCTRDNLNAALDTLIAMQQRWWNHPPFPAGSHYSQSLSGRTKRREYLNDAQLERAYDAFLDCYSAVNRTLCHDDLLPFNVLCQDDQAVFIDWEVGGILPYPVSLARLIAHGEEHEDAFFYMTKTDKCFAIDYYFEQFIKKMNISKSEYLRTMDLFLFYEYCEWVYVGNFYNETNTLRFQSYLQKAKQLASELGF